MYVYVYSVGKLLKSINRGQNTNCASLTVVELISPKLIYRFIHKDYS